MSFGVVMALVVCHNNTGVASPFADTVKAMPPCYGVRVLHILFMPFPYLGGAISPNDVSQKGKGSYAADYVAWAKTLQLLNEKAPGWSPELKENSDHQHCFLAPDNTAYLLVRFTNLETSEQTNWWPYAITDHQNNPVDFEKINSRRLCDSQRRAVCSAACAAFSLSYELWAREEVTDNDEEVMPPCPLPAPKETKKAKPSKPAEAKPSAAPTVNREPLENALIELLQVKMERGKTLEYLDSKAKAWGLSKGGSRVQQMSPSQLQTCIDELSAEKAT